jgi:hypothetical protein
MLQLVQEQVLRVYDVVGPAGVIAAVLLYALALVWDVRRAHRRWFDLTRKR